MFPARDWCFAEIKTISSAQDGEMVLSFLFTKNVYSEPGTANYARTWQNAYESNHLLCTF